MNISQEKREKMLMLLSKIKEEKKEDKDVVIALNEIENEIKNMKYGLMWEEHEEAVDKELEHSIPIFSEEKDKKILVDEKGKFNFLLEGDNLHSLKLLQRTHKEKIDIIYIDPPYNTKNKDFIYDDNMIGEDDGYRHSKWLSFMQRRLEIAKDLLTDDGVIFISIDDNEQAQLKLLCDNIFGENNFVACINIQTASNVYGPKASSLNKTIVKVKETLVVYAKNKQNINFLRPLKTAKKSKFDNHFNRAIKNNKVVSWKEVVGEDDRLRKELEKYNLNLSHSNLEIIFNLNNSIYEYFLKKYSDKIFQDSAYNSDTSNYSEELSKGNIVKINGIDVFCGLDGKSSPRFLTPLSKSISLSDDYDAILSDTAYRGNSWDYSIDMNNIGKEGGVDFKSGKKPLRLIKDILKLMNNKSAIILDFFAGSGTTGHAVAKLNAEDGGNRTYILCTNNENNICEEVTYKRLLGIQKELPHNLKYFKTDFLEKSNEDLLYDLMEHMNEMVILENGYLKESKRYAVILTDEDMDELEEHISEYTNLERIYMSNEVLLTSKQNNILSNYEIKYIPQYYFDNELKEMGEMW